MRRPATNSNAPSVTRITPALYGSIAGLYLLLAASVHGASPIVPRPAAPFLIRDSAIVVGNGTSGPYFISGYFIVHGSETVIDLLRSDSLSRTDYTLDPNKGWIEFTSPLTHGDSVTVSFVRLAFVCPAESRALQPTAAGLVFSQILPVSEVVAGGFEPPTIAPASRARVPAPTSLQWRGYKSSSVSTSSGRSADWSQGLDLAVSGDLTQGLKLTAALSDRASGTSGRSGPDATRLGDLDKLYIEARSANFEGRWGSLAVTDASAGPTTRHATGLRMGWTTPASRTGVYAGYATGEVVRRALPVQVGDAGPYRLVEQAGITVVPGSISLTLDGNRLREGPESDYVFDPQLSTITFNPSVALASHPLVVVEFEKTLDSYRRFLAGGEWSWSDKRHALQLSTGGHWESDDPDRPVFGSLTDAQRHLLAQTPNDQVTVPAANYAGARRGDYRLDIRNNDDSAFVYVGPNNGDWRVIFNRVGAGLGRYRHLAESAYEFVGVGKGAYEPTASLGAPKTNAAVTQSIDVEARHFGRFEGLWSGSLHDANRLAANSTRLLSDHRLRWSLGEQGSNPTSSLSNASSISALRVDWRRVTARERRVAGIDDLPRFLNTWGIRSAVFDESRNDYQLSATTGKPGYLAIATDVGLLNTRTMQAWRLSVATSTHIWRSLTARLKLNQRSADGRGVDSAGRDWSALYETRLTFSPRRVQFEMGWRQDRLSNHTRCFEPAPDLAMARWLSLVWGHVTTEYRWEAIHDSSALSRRSRELSLSASIDNHPLQGRLTVARGQQSIGGGPFSPYYRGQLAERWQPGAGFTVDASIRLTRGHAGAQSEVYLPTAPGQGQYRLERGEYVPDLRGDYRRVLATADGTNEDTYDGEQRIACSWQPLTFGWRWKLESQIERRAQYDPGRFRPGVWILPWNSHQSAYLLNSRSDQRHRLRAAVQPDRHTELSAGLTSDRAQVRGAGLNDRHDQYQFTARRNFNNLAYIRGEISQENRRRDRSGSSGLSSRATTFSAAIGAAPAVGLSWSVEGRRRSEREANLDNSVGLWGLHPSLRSGMGPFCLSIETDATWVTSERPGSVLSALLAEGRPAGFSLTQFCELRVQLPGRIAIRSNLNADLRNDGPNRWRWELETTAAF